MKPLVYTGDIIWSHVAITVQLLDKGIEYFVCYMSIITNPQSKSQFGGSLEDPAYTEL